MAISVGVSKKGPKSVPTTPDRPQMVLGSRPPGMYSPRIKPMTGQTQYGKTDPTNPAAAVGPRQPNIGGASFGNTGQTDMS